MRGDRACVLDHLAAEPPAVVGGLFEIGPPRRRGRLAGRARPVATLVLRALPLDRHERPPDPGRSSAVDRDRDAEQAAVLVEEGLPVPDVLQFPEGRRAAAEDLLRVDRHALQGRRLAVEPQRIVLELAIEDRVGPGELEDQLLEDSAGPSAARPRGRPRASRRPPGHAPRGSARRAVPPTRDARPRRSGRPPGSRAGRPLRGRPGRGALSRDRGRRSACPRRSIDRCRRGRASQSGAAHRSSRVTPAFSRIGESTPRSTIRIGEPSDRASGDSRA